MRVCLKECKDAELVRSSVPIARKNDIYENTQPEIENCSDGIAPQPNTAVDGSQKMIAPVVVSMTKYLFAHYRLQMYAYLNNSLRSGMLERILLHHGTPSSRVLCFAFILQGFIRGVKRKSRYT